MTRKASRRQTGAARKAIGKQVNGRKRHILGDTLGLLLAVAVTAASTQDRDGARLLLKVLAHRWMRLRLIWADSAYAAELVAWVRPLARAPPPHVGERAAVGGAERVRGLAEAVDRRARLRVAQPVSPVEPRL